MLNKRQSGEPTSVNAAKLTSLIRGWWVVAIARDNVVIENRLGPDLQNILRQSYDYLTIMSKLRSTYDRRLIHETSYEGRKAFLKYNSLAKS